MCNAATQYLSYQIVGSITFYGNAEKESEECLAKSRGNEKGAEIMRN
jgi:hypothetical protein